MQISDVPSEKALPQIKAATQKRRATADLEAQSALDRFIAAIDRATSAYQNPAGLLPKVQVSDELDGGVSAMSRRCKAAGSSAFQ